MLKLFEKLCLLFVAVAPLQAWGRPIIVTEYKENFMKDTTDDSLKCRNGWSTNKTENADCRQLTLPGGTICYLCSCSSSYNLDKCPSHGICTECNGKKRLDGCDDFWAMNAERNTCKEVCKGYTSKCPANASCYKCTAGSVTLYKFKSCNAGYGLVGDHCELSHTHEYKCPDGYSETNSWGDDAVTTSKVCSCGTTGSGTCYKAPNCVDGGSSNCSGDISVCVGKVEVSSCLDCSGTTRYTCRDKTCADDGKKECNGTCIEYSECCGGCADGSSCVNGECVEDKCSLANCIDSVTEKPTNSYYVQETCTDCQGAHTIKTDWQCNAGYEKSGNACKEICIPLADDVGCVGETQKCVDGCGGTRKCCKTCIEGGSPLCSGSTVACTASQVQTATCTDCGGTIHYSCRAKTCAEQNLKECNGSCIGLNECCGGCGKGYHCSNSTCLAD